MNFFYLKCQAYSLAYLKLHLLEEISCISLESKFDSEIKERKWKALPKLYRPRNLLKESRRFMTWFDFVVASSNSFLSSTFSYLKFCSRVELDRDFKFEFEKSKFAHL